MRTVDAATYLRVATNVDRPESPEEDVASAISGTKYPIQWAMNQNELLTSVYPSPARSSI